LNLSEGSVALRLQVANVARRFPQVLAALAEGRISLTVAGLLAPHLNEENVEKLLSDCTGRTKRATEEYLVTLRPKPVFEPSIRKLPEPLRPAPATPMPPPETPRPRPSPAPILAPATPTQFNFRFSADRRFKEKLERLAEVLGIANPEKSLVEILEQAIDVTLDKKDPRRRLARRREREVRRTKSRPDEIFPKPDNPASRYVSAEVRERVHARADYQCEYRGPTGTRCRSRTGLEIEHTRPFAIFQSHDERYLRLYCAAHNRFRAERVYGRAFIESKIASARGTARSATQRRNDRGPTTTSRPSVGGRPRRSRCHREGASR
jgi:hypothetical protein